MIYGYIRTSRTAVDGLAGMHPKPRSGPWPAPAWSRPISSRSFLP